MHKKPSLLLIGGGNMGRALLSAWRKQDLVDDVTVVEPYPAPELTTMAHVVSDMASVQGTYDAVILATKPQIAADLMPQITKFVTKDNFFLSIAAGKQTDFFQKFLGADKAIIRVMPNTPCQINEGVTALYATPVAPQPMRDLAQRLFAATGFTFTVTDEDKMHAITAISGSGPGFAFYLMELLEKNMSRDEAINKIVSCAHPFCQAYETASLKHEIADSSTTHHIVTQIFKGSALLAKSQPDHSFAQLRQAVTSPNGTTQAGLDVLIKASDAVTLAPLAEAALDVATKRSRELAL